MSSKQYIKSDIVIRYSDIEETVMSEWNTTGRFVSFNKFFNQIVLIFFVRQRQICWETWQFTKVYGIWVVYNSSIQ